MCKLKIAGVMYVILACALYGLGENIRTIQAEFIQKTISQDNTLIYSGYFYAKAPSKAKWIYHTPTKKEIYINRETTIVYEPLLEQATFGRAQQKIDFFKILKNAKLKEDNKYYATFEQIQYQLTLKQDNIPKQITFRDEFENTVIIDFKKVKLNQPIDDDVFNFTPPQGIDIIQY